MSLPSGFDPKDISSAQYRDMLEAPTIELSGVIRGGDLKVRGTVRWHGEVVLRTDALSGANPTHAELRVRQRIMDRLWHEDRDAFYAVLASSSVPDELLPAEYKTARPEVTV